MSVRSAVLNSAHFKREYFQREDICRLCWSQNACKDLYSKMIDCALKSPLFFRIQNCLNIDLSEDSEFHPKKVCEDCFVKIENFNNFKIFCDESNRKLGKILNNSFSKSPLKSLEIKLEKRESYTNLDLGEIVPDRVDLPASLADVPTTERLDPDSASVESLDSFIDSLGNPYQVKKEPLKNPKSNKKRCSKAKNPSCHTPDKPIHSIVSEIANLERLNSLSYAESNSDNDEIPLERLKTKSCDEINDLLESHQLPECTSENGESPSIITTIAKNLRYNYKAKKCPTYCNICCENFLDEESFIKHNSAAHGIEKDGKFKCFGCKKVFSNRKTRLGHEIHFCKGLEDGYKCTLCNRFLPRRGQYEKHMKSHRKNKVIDVSDHVFTCNKCDEQFDNKASLKEHMENHGPKEKCICETCGRVFTRRDYLNKHKVIHTGERKYVCPHCGFRTTQKTNLTIHIRKHTDERPYACDLCPQRCVSSSNLLAHRRRHLGLKSYQCSICNKKFGYKMSLKDHIEVTHEKSQSHPCPHCGAIYARRRGLNRHLLAKHPVETQKIRMNKVPNSKPKSTPGVLYPNGDKNKQECLYPNVNLNLEEKSDSNQKNAVVPHLNLNNGNTNMQEGQGKFALKLGDSEKFVCFNENLDLGLKEGEKIVILLQQQ